MARCISFHSYKGGTGKTTLAANFSYWLASKGYKVYLLDLDFYAPSLYSYFNFEPPYWINDYLKNRANLKAIMVDSSRFLDTKLEGELKIGFSRGGKEDIYQLEGNLLNDREGQVKQFRNFIAMREELLVEENADFVVMDTSPGIRYWSINSIVISDIVLLTLKMGDLDLKGTVKMVKEIYGSLIEHGTICKLLLNRVSGYCVPSSMTAHRSIQIVDNDSFFKNKIELELGKIIDKSFDIDTLIEIPCYCDIQFKEREFLTANQFPDHPFTEKIQKLVTEIENMN
ncbi:MinD/ParA family ATP-binding protein [Candidatus Nitrosocosmicus franklandus]|uniref:Antiporter inner membrane protein n=1 Tax=Candidatus Nitrosocosmicus franklandianus TaxID=1798806 RepID=A0A484IDB7_9ARCH|nr:AAA family ATPase [Candidatus Nitrosocosmicus franklandus]VFJ12974.1 Antiporter inner membrane protein [Candidatus Nitrosocosmicus franklandus]